MARVRGTDLIDAEAFVRESYGVDAAEELRGTLNPETAALYRKPPKDSSWYPLEALTSYLIAAKATLDPASADFHRRQGRFAAERQKRGPLSSMVSSAWLRMRLARIVWRIYNDVGRLEVIGDSPRHSFTRIHDFPATPETCERFLGIWEGLAGPGTRAEETCCVLRDDPYCEIHIRYDEPG
jgi:hypothetical protein